jgi:hypothetical protein
MTMAREIHNDDDIIDSRDVIERIEELQGLDADPESGLEAEEAAELAALVALAEQGEAFEDWKYGETLIRDSYFVDYAKEYADDVVGNLKTMGWPFNHIDWEAAAEEIQTDYTSIDFDGVAFWVR